MSNPSDPMHPGDLYEDLRPIYLNSNAELHPTVARWLKTLKDDVEMLKKQARPSDPSDPSVPEKVWVIHYSNYPYVTMDKDEAAYEVGKGYAERYSGPYRLISA